MAQEENSGISNRDAYPLCNKPVKTGVECGIECRMLKNYRGNST